MSHPENDDSTPVTEALAGMGFSDPAGIAAAIERSSLGAPEAQAARASISDEAARAVVERSKELNPRDEVEAAMVEIVDLLEEVFSLHGALAYWSERFAYLSDRRPADVLGERDLDGLRLIANRLTALAEGAFL